MFFYCYYLIHSLLVCLFLDILNCDQLFVWFRKFERNNYCFILLVLVQTWGKGGGVMPRPFLLHGNSRKVFHGFRWIEYLEIEKLSKRVDNITSVTVFIICHWNFAHVCKFILVGLPILGISFKIRIFCMGMVWPILTFVVRGVNYLLRQGTVNGSYNVPVGPLHF